MSNDTNFKKENYCGNCGEEGHTYRRCLAPIMSLGVILYKQENDLIKYLMIQRRDTLGFVEFMRGKYNLENSKYIYELFKIMTENERIKILNNDFDYLWQNLWMNKNLKKFQNEYNNSKKKFICLKKGIEIDGKIISLLKIHESVDIYWKSPEWGFPKGRRNLKESDIQCAKREFEEESGYTSDNYEIVNDIDPIVELFSGTNNIRYKHIYYIGKSLNDISLKINKDNFNQASEISKIKWATFDEAISSIRDYNIEKKDVIKNVHELLTKKIFVNINDE
jgi:8-oxo-dGTP pyrophosphatase MutT (NUDIX family)